MKNKLEELLGKYSVQQGKIPLKGTVAEENIGKTKYIYPVSLTNNGLIVFYVYNNEINVASSFTQNHIASGDNPISLDTVEIILKTGLDGMVPLDTTKLSQ